MDPSYSGGKKETHKQRDKEKVFRENPPKDGMWKEMRSKPFLKGFTESIRVFSSKQGQRTYAGTYRRYLRTSWIPLFFPFPMKHGWESTKKIEKGRNRPPGRLASVPIPETVSMDVSCLGRPKTGFGFWDVSSRNCNGTQTNRKVTLILFGSFHPETTIGFLLKNAFPFSLSRKKGKAMDSFILVLGCTIGVTIEAGCRRSMEGCPRRKWESMRSSFSGIGSMEGSMRSSSMEETTGHVERMCMEHARLPSELRDRAHEKARNASCR